MQSLFKTLLCLEIVKSSLAIFENPFKLQHLFSRLFEIDSKLCQMATIDKDILIFQEKVLAFRQEIEVAMEMAGRQKHPKPPNARGFLGRIGVESFLKI